MALLSHKDLKARPNLSAVYARHRPERTLFYQIIREYWPEFQAELANQDKFLPAYITQEFEAYLKCGRLEHGFLRIRCETCHDERLVAFSCKRRGTEIGLQRRHLKPELSPGHSGWVKFRNHAKRKYGFTGFSITVDFWLYSFNASYPLILHYPLK